MVIAEKEYQRKPMSDEERAAIIADRKAGMSYDQLQTKYKRTSSSLARIFRKVGLTPDSRRIPKETIEQIEELAKQGWTAKAIAQKLKRPVASVSNYMPGSARTKRRKELAKRKPKAPAKLPAVVESSPLMEDGFKEALSNWMERNGIVSVRRLGDGRLSLSVQKEMVI